MTTGLTYKLSLAICLLWTATALGDSSPIVRRLTKAKKLYIEQEYEKVIHSLTPVVQSPMATITHKVEAYELLGLSYLILGDTQRARHMFENLLGLDPGHLLRDPSGSPKLRRFYEEVKAALVPGYDGPARVTLEHAAPPRAVAGRRVEFAARIVHGGESIQSVILRWRRSGLLTYRTAAMRGHGSRLRARFILPGDHRSYTLEYYLEVRDSSGHTLARIGAPDQPLSVYVTGASSGDRDGPIYKRWWFWATVGALVAGGVTAGAIAVSAESAPKGNLEPLIHLR